MPLLFFTIFSAGAACEHCEWAPDKIDSFLAFAPALAYENSGFKESYFHMLAQLEAKNFWFRTRNKLITWALSEYYPAFESFLEIGCGTGYVLSGIAEKFPDRLWSQTNVNACHVRRYNAHDLHSLVSRLYAAPHLCSPCIFRGYFKEKPHRMMIPIMNFVCHLFSILFWRKC